MTGFVFADFFSELNSLLGAYEELQMKQQKSLLMIKELEDLKQKIVERRRGLIVERANCYKLWVCPEGVKLEIEINKIGEELVEMDLRLRVKYIELRTRDREHLALITRLYDAMKRAGLGYEIQRVREADNPFEEAKKLL